MATMNWGARTQTQLAMTCVGGQYVMVGKKRLSASWDGGKAEIEVVRAFGMDTQTHGRSECADQPNNITLTCRRNCMRAKQDMTIVTLFLYTRLLTPRNRSNQYCPDLKHDQTCLRQQVWNRFQTSIRPVTYEFSRHSFAYFSNIYIYICIHITCKTPCI